MKKIVTKAAITSEISKLENGIDVKTPCVVC
jgi:hypothetical protein